MSTNIKDAVIFIPGLGGSERLFAPVVKLWKFVFGFEAYVFPVRWYKSESINSKLKRIVNLSQQLKHSSRRVSLIGSSAGGSAAFNVFTENQDLIYKAINVGGRLRRGPQKGFRSFEVRTTSSHSFKDSVIKFEDLNEPQLSKVAKTRLLTVRALLGDELVPWDTTIVKGAKNIFAPCGEHMLTNALSLTVFALPLISFLRR